MMLVWNDKAKVERTIIDYLTRCGGQFDKDSGILFFGDKIHMSPAMLRGLIEEACGGPT